MAENDGGATCDALLGDVQRVFFYFNFFTVPLKRRLLKAVFFVVSPFCVCIRGNNDLFRLIKENKINVLFFHLFLQTTLPSSSKCCLRWCPRRRWQCLTRIGYHHYHPSPGTAHEPIPILELILNPHRSWNRS